MKNAKQDGTSPIRNRKSGRTGPNKLGKHQKQNVSNGTSILFVNDKGQILLCLRDDKPNILYPNCWDIIGGHVEPGETPQQCIVREVKEEIGRKVKNLNFYKKTEFKDRTEHTFWEKVNIKIRQTNLTEGQKLKWFTEKQIKELPERKIAFGFKPIILEFFKDVVKGCKEVRK